MEWWEYLDNNQDNLKLVKEFLDDNTQKKVNLGEVP